MVDGGGVNGGADGGAGGALSGRAAARMVARAVSEMGIARALRWHAITGTTRVDCFLLQVVLGNQSVDDGPARPVSALAIAQSMGLPYETVRRRVIALGQTGLVAPSAGGWIVPRDRLTGWLEAGLYRQDGRAVVAMLEQLATYGYQPAAAALDRAAAEGDHRLGHRLLGFVMRSLADFTRLYGNLVDGSIATAIIAANVRHLTEARDPARRWAAEALVPPDSERRPVALRGLARELDMPFETVRRRVAEMVEAGRVERSGDGYIVPARVLDGPAFRAHTLDLVAELERLLAEIGQPD